MIDHIVQFHDADDRALIGSVAGYLAEGVRKGDGVIVVGTPEHNAAFVRELAADGIDAAARPRLVFLDAAAMLARFMVGGMPDAERFAATVGGAIRDLRALSKDNDVRAYGEMVGVLWQAGQYAAAIRLEALWNELLLNGGLMLFCGYPIDVYADGFSADHVDALLCAHTHVLPSAGELADALDAAMSEILGPAAAGVRSAMSASSQAAWAALPRGEAMILWLRRNLPDYAPAIVERARSFARAA